jgi:DNA-binding CsgD family transcriptional regulator
MDRPSPLGLADALSAAGRVAGEAAAVIGSELELELLAEVNGGASGIEALLESGLLFERTPGIGSFRTPRARDEIYTSIPWTRRRVLHRRVAEALEKGRGPADQIAAHWHAAGEAGRARCALLEAAGRSREAHRHAETVRLLRLALDAWLTGDEEQERLLALEHLGDAAQTAGMLSDALRAWREVVESAGGSMRARALRKTANLYELNCDWNRGLEVRLDAMDAFGVNGEHAEAAIEGLAAALRLRLWARHAAALEVLVGAARHAQAAGREDLRVRIAALEGNLHARLGQANEGIAAIRAALDAALTLDEPELVGEIYKYLGDAFFRSTDFSQAAAVSLQGIAFCEQRDSAGGVAGCLGCMICILARCGRWEEGLDACKQVLASLASDAKVRSQALAYAGLMHALRGEGRKAEPLLLEGDALARRLEHVLAELICRWGFALRDASTGDHAAAAERCSGILSRLRRTDEQYYAIPILRWAASCFSRADDREGLRACADAFSEAAAVYSHAEPLSALAHALGETAWLEGDLPRAAQQFEHAIQLLDELQLPRERAESQLRAAAVYAASGQSEAALRHAREAARAAERLGARALAEEAAQQVRALNAPLEEAIGRRGAQRAADGGLTPRQIEVLCQISRGLTDKEIARCLRLSPRTVEMHVARALAVLDARSRAEAVRKAGELGVLGRPVP